ncbi:hypothetical protein [Bowmanella dokdonensis]|uniref:Uncharacterized protein n=1 Tax=Bowmanella dokdonensis TaxID=751969 RepID=A0A939DLI8_9ALTE|nr:hypothetical protein [Bowmanella dokdonensis]MBN7824959.1 hypothetical protein [Bowmanella dokdonensis]
MDEQLLTKVQQSGLTSQVSGDLQKIVHMAGQGAASLGGKELSTKSVDNYVDENGRKSRSSVKMLSTPGSTILAK